jgi:hypothetical protein
MNLFHLLSAIQIDIPFLLLSAESQRAEQVLHPGGILQSFHKQKMEVLSRISGSEELPFIEKLIVAPEGYQGFVYPGFEFQLCPGFGEYRIFGFLIQRNSEVHSQLSGSGCRSDSKEPGSEGDHISGGTAAEAIEGFIHLHTGAAVIVERADRHAVEIHMEPKALSSLPGSDGLLDVRVVDQTGITSLFDF